MLYGASRPAPSALLHVKSERILIHVLLEEIEYIWQLMQAAYPMHTSDLLAVMYSTVNFKLVVQGFWKWVVSLVCTSQSNL